MRPRWSPDITGVPEETPESDSRTGTWTEHAAPLESDLARFREGLPKPSVPTNSSPGKAWASVSEAFTHSKRFGGRFK